MGHTRASVLLVLAGAASLVLALVLRRSAEVTGHPTDTLAVWG